MFVKYLQWQKMHLKHEQIYFCSLSAIYDVEAGELLKLVLER